MEVKSKLRPGENGTKTLLKQYGEQLVCVRFAMTSSGGNAIKP
jgi:hypothetical protein